MKSRTAVLKVVLAGVVALASAQAQADVIKHGVRLGAFKLIDSLVYVPLTTSGADIVTFSGSGRFTIWYTAECAASGYVAVEVRVDGRQLSPLGNNPDDSFCDPDTRGAMHTVTVRSESLAAGTHKVEVLATSSSGLAYLSDSSLLIGK